LKYTPKGRVLVGCRRRGNKLQILVCDTGIGIPRGRQKQIFMEFKRLDQGASIARGLGLGLSIVERIARVLDQKISVYSLPEKGSIFSLELPLSTMKVAEEVTIVEPVSNSSIAGLKILCIDNEPVILEGMRLLLEGWGCDVVTAANDRSAVATFKQGQPLPDAIVADYHLDKGNGLSAITLVQKAARQPLPAILLTADRTTELRDKAASRNVQMLNKPLKPAQLRAWLSQIKVQQRLAAE
jgi:CheY-like chemotaxis protein